ncbi:MAG: metal ABC transporter permease [Actinomycetota bacterium]|nr:metal ABC transporter permease [Actinomycetota bacterium]MDQ3681058.1 metal ABC transporter permease [Actinomycetota bacterium]
MNLPLPWPFERDYMQLALVAGLVVGVCAPLIGTFLVQKRMSLMGDGIGHVAFAGVAAGLVFGVWPIGTALLAAVAGAVGIEWLRTRGRAGGDLALAVLFYSGIAAGVVLTGLAGSLDASTLTYLFGSILTVNEGDAVTIAILGVAILGSVVVGWRALFTVILDEEAGRVAGLPVDALNLALAALTAVTVVAGMRVVGVLLVAALMVLPVGAAQRLARSFRGTLIAASAIGSLSAVAGLTAARAFGLAPGGTVVLVAAACFIVATASKAPGRSRLLMAPSTARR